MRRMGLMPMLLCGGALAACAATGPREGRAPLPREQSAALASLVVRLGNPRQGNASSAGSATVLGGGRLLTCFHVVAPEVARVTGSSEAEGRHGEVEPWLVGAFDGHPSSYRVVRSGGASEPAANDWALLQLGSAPEPFELPGCPAADFDPHWEAEPGQEVFLVGYWNSGSTPAVPGRPTILRGRVAGPFTSVPEGVVPIDLGSDVRYDGMSGGAAVVWDGETNRPIVVGIQRGRGEVRALGITWDRVTAIRRVPAQALDP